MEKDNSDCDISVSIVSYNTCDLLRACLNSLGTQQGGDASLQTIVVDNGSNDGSIEMLGDEFPAVKVLQSGANLGYGRANNLAFSIARGRYFLILNSDTEVSPAALDYMTYWMDAHPEAGAVGPRLVLPDGRTQVSWSRDPSVFGVFCEQSFLDRCVPNRQTFEDSISSDLSEEAWEVEQVCAAALLVRREAFELAGGFNSRFFMYYEDTDLCLRIRDLGYKIFFLPQAQVRHILGASSENLDARSDMIVSCNTSRSLFFLIHHGLFAAHVVKMLAMCGALLRSLSWSYAALLGKKQASSRVKMFRRVLRHTAKISLKDDVG